MIRGSELSGGWILTDGVMTRIECEGCTDVRSALAACGILPAEIQLSGLQREEWIYRRAWEYRRALQAPPDAERCRVRAEGILSPGTLYVNGQAADRIRPGAGEWDISPWLRGGENEIAFRFDLPGRAGALGMCGPVFAEGENFASVEEMVVRGSGPFEVTSGVYAYTAGKYTFRYTAAADGEALWKGEFQQRLRVGMQRISHSLPLAQTAQPPLIRLTLERMGILCSRADGVASPSGRAAGRILVLDGAPPLSLGEDPRLKAAADLGANGILWQGGSPSDPAPCGFLPCARGAEELRFPAPDRTERLKKLAGETPFWPCDAPLWKLTESDGIPGAEPSGDADADVALHRWLQAERLRQAAVRARLEGRAAMVLWHGDALRVSGAALTDGDGAVRPAFRALRSVWQETAGCAILPERLTVPGGALLRIPICLLSDGASRRPLTVEARALSAGGEELAAVRLAAFSAGSARIGHLTADPSRAGGCLRIEVRALEADGSIVSEAVCALPVDALSPLAPRLAGLADAPAGE
ncbi:MAG: hypothetical protein IKE30_08725 [Clostridia bacterium]|nr:hypothetical protein [Clostridia bacterium]